MKEAPDSSPNLTSTATQITGHVSPLDVEFLEEIAGKTWNGDYAAYAFNLGGAIEEFSFKETITIKARGSRRFGAYSSKKSSSFKVAIKEEEFTYNVADGLLTINLQGDGSLRDIEIVY
ncbi:Galactinol--sucrose galactosyltransferase [Abeliophyllum distichum]|uniref:Galactinol--sucrose galactosyltransferase n=1 Tax=Abeliophyllum distichum TaxID=126358 RepID=A0ABD1VZA5_9LAMI